LARGCLDRELAAVLLRDAVRDREPEAGALIATFGGFFVAESRSQGTSGLEEVLERAGACAWASPV
jgi:hypothetical protein